MSGISLYPLCATGLMIGVIIFDYARRLNTDSFLRKIYISVLSSLLLAIVSNSAVKLLDGRPGAAVHTLLFIFSNAFFIFQHSSYYLAVLLVDYIANKNSTRSKKMGLIVLGIMALYVIIMLLNISYGFYFSISGDNRYTDGTMFLVRFYLGYAAILMVIIDLVLSTKYLKQFYLYLVIFFMILIGAGAALDMFFSDGNLIWAFFTAGMLQAYFFIIRSDTTVDKVTGIGNRSSFNEYINRIIRLPEKENYSLCMFDINGLKKINESLGVEEGDRALADLADILKKCSRQNDFIARIGGDEFIVIIRAKYIIEKLITRILKTIDARNEKKERPYTLSIAYGYDKFTTRSDQSIDEFLIHLKGLVFQHKNDQQREAGVRSV